MFLDKLCNMQISIFCLLRLFLSHDVYKMQNAGKRSQIQKLVAHQWKLMCHKFWSAPFFLPGSFAATESFHGNHHHLVLLCAARTPREEDAILGFLLHPLDRIHGNALHDVTTTQLSRWVPQETHTNVAALIKVLPHVNADVLLQMEANIHRLQTETILAWKGASHASDDHVDHFLIQCVVSTCREGSCNYQKVVL